MDEKVMMGWREFKVSEKIGDGPGKTNTVQFRNQTDSKGKYTLKVGDAPSKRHELKAGEKSEKYEIQKKAWNASNEGSTALEYERDNRADPNVT